MDGSTEARVSDGMIYRLLSRNRHCNWEWGWRLSDVDPPPSIDQSGFSRKERNLHCDVQATYTSPLKTNTYCRRSGRQTRCGWRDRSDPDVAIKAYCITWTQSSSFRQHNTNNPSQSSWMDNKIHSRGTLLVVMSTAIAATTEITNCRRTTQCSVTDKFTRADTY